MRTRLFSHLVLVVGLVLGLAGLSPAVAGSLGGGYFAQTLSGGCDPSGHPCGYTQLLSTGTTSWGGFESPGFHGSAQTAWFDDSFGLYARGDANTTGDSGLGSGYAYGLLFEPILIAPQAGMAQGDPGTFQPHYHLDGTVTIDWGGTNSPGNPLGGQVDLRWGFGSFDNPQGTGTPTASGLLVDERWRADHLSVVVDRTVTPTVPFRFGEIFYFEYVIRLSATVFSSAPPSIGFAEGDFIHTGTLTGATVLDKFGQPIDNPVVIADSGVNFVSPNAPAGVPEPGSLFLLGGAAAMLGLGRLRAPRRLVRGAAPARVGTA